MTQRRASIRVAGRAFAMGRLTQWAVLLAAFQLGVWILGAGTNGAWLLIWALVVSAVFALHGSTIRISPHLVVASQIISGMLVGRTIDLPVMAQMVDMWYLVLLFGVAIVVISIAVGAIVARLGGLDPAIGAWGFMPGLASVMIAQADEMGLDGRQVAIMQLFRLVAVITAMMALSLYFQPGGLREIGPVESQPARLFWLPAVLAAGFIAHRFASAIPAAATIVALALAALITIETGTTIAMPRPIIDAAFAIIGFQVGLRFTPDLLRGAVGTVPVILCGSLLLIGVSGALAFLLMALSGTDYLSSFLALVPGSLDTIGVLVLATNSSVSLIMTLQTARLIILTTIGPSLASLVSRRVRRHRSDA